MAKNLTPELKSYKEEFDFIHKKLGELQWELITIYYGRKAVHRDEFDIIEDQIASYRDSIEILIERTKNEVAKANRSK